MAENLNKIWANGTPLSEYFDGILKEACLDETRFDEMEKLFAESSDGNGGYNVVSSIGLALNNASREKARRERALTVLRNKLVAEEIRFVGLGLDSDGKPKTFWIQDDFWIAADIWPEADRAQLGDVQIDQLRLVPQEVKQRDDSAEPPRHLPSDVPLLPMKTPPATILRPLAIEACFDAGEIDFDDSNLPERMGRYEAWIAENYPACDVTQRGFKPKTWEADESSFKESRGLSAPRK